MSPETPLPLVADDTCLSAPVPHAPDPSQPEAPPAHRAVYIETYGCQMNVADTEVVASFLSDAGYRLVERPEEADILLLNTCSVREKAQEKVF